MRKLTLIFSSLFFALPVAAQEAAPSAPPPKDKVELKDEMPVAKPDEPSTNSVPTAPSQPEGTVGEPVAAPPSKKAAQAPAVPVHGPAIAADDDSWKFEFHGYIRAPMRVGLGKRDKPGAGQSTTTLHSPIIPDDQYLSWQSSPHNKTDWAELYLSLGNSWAKGTVSIQGYNFADAGFSNPTTQLGISVGCAFCLIYVGVALLHGTTPGLLQITEILIDSVLMIGGGHLFFKGIKAKTKEMGVFSELRTTIVIGAVAMLYVAISSLVKVVFS